jgi:uncharacterized protein
MKYITIVLLAALLIGYFLGGYFNSKTVTVETTTPSKIYTVFTAPTIVNEENASFATIIVPAVDEDGNGVATFLDVQVMEGSGRVLTNIDKLLFWTDTQSSIRTAKSVAENLTKVDLSDKDIIYTIRANASVIEGPSAGAALTIATVAVLLDRQINQSVMITGTINHDGTVGPVGKVFEKAMAAKSIGAELFLVPVSQSTQISYQTQRYCEKIGWTEICTLEQVPSRIDVADEADIEVREVRDISQALGYFLV